MADKPTICERYAAAWSEMHNPPLDSVNPHFRNRFASLAATLQAIREPCARHGLVYRQPVIRRDDGTLVLETSVMDESGVIISLSTFPLNPNNDPQKFGSQLTYAKRQAAQADWALVGDVDDDGEAAAAKGSVAPQEPTRAQQAQSRDYTPLKMECERLAALHSTTVPEEWAALVGIYGDPRDMNDRDYEAFLAFVRMMEVSE